MDLTNNNEPTGEIKSCKSTSTSIYYVSLFTSIYFCRSQFVIFLFKICCKMCVYTQKQ